MTIPHTSRRTFLATTAALSAAGIIGGPFSSMARGQSAALLRVRATRDIAILDPGYMIGGAEITTQLAVMPTLVEYETTDGKLGWKPTAYVKEIGHRDPTHIDFTLNTGLMWTNGFGEFTADDVKFSLERMKESEWSGYFDLMEGVEVTGSHSGTIKMSAPFAPFWLTALASGVAVIQCKKAIEGLETGQYTTEIPATCGPYVYEWRPKDRIVFTRDPDWTGPKPDFNEVQYILIEEDQTAELAYEAGEIDVTGISTTTYARYQKDMPANSATVVAGALNWMWMGMNTEHPKLQDIRIRQAIQHAVDVDSINAGAYSNTVVKSNGIVCPGLAGQRMASNYSYDPAKARALLSEAGSSGLQLDLNVQNIPEWVLAAQIIQANLQAVGIEVKVNPLDPGPFWDMGQESKGDAWKDLQIWIMRYGTSPDAYEGFQWYLKDQVGVWNWERWVDPEFDELYDKGLVETDPDERVRIYLRMQEIMEDTGAYVWLNHEPEVFIYNTDIEVDVTPSGNIELRDFKSV
jgi:peptide/nickel transport system substrate-binding protein